MHHGGNYFKLWINPGNWRLNLLPSTYLLDIDEDFISWLAL